MACCADKSRLATIVTAGNTGSCVGELLCKFLLSDVGKAYF